MIKFKNNFILPDFLLTLTPVSTKTGDTKANIISRTNDLELQISWNNVKPEPVVIDNESSLTLIIGAPVVEDRIDYDKAAKMLKENGSISSQSLKSLNGEFLIIDFDKETSELSIANDRYTSIPFFYNHDTENSSFSASVYFSSIWKHLEKTGKRQFNQNAFFEFLWFQRLFGTKTYDKNTFFLPDASLLSLKEKHLQCSNYWNRDYTKSKLSLSEHSKQMADMIRQSVKRKTSDDKRFGHFLSGGMDSRSVLCGFEEPPVCFTSTVSENREFRTAQKIAKAKGAKHIGLELDPEHFGKIFRHSTEVIGGMYNYDHGLFYGFNDAVSEYADVCFHGHGFDYMFQGMYIPGENVVLGGRNLYLRFMKELPEDMVSYFIDNASYRIKNADVWSVIDEDRKDELKEFQHNSIQEILDKGKTLTDNTNDLWEYLTFHYISRHYSYPNHASIATFAEQRTVSFDNDLFDLYLSLPASHRFNGKIEKACLKLMSPEIAAIWSANTDLPVTASCWTQTLYQLSGFIKRRIIPEKAVPTWQERTWPAREDALRQQTSLKKAINKLCKSDTLEKLDFIDIEKIRNDVPKWIDGENIPGISGDLVQSLLTIGTFLEQ